MKFHLALIYSTLHALEWSIVVISKTVEDNPIVIINDGKELIY